MSEWWYSGVVLSVCPSAEFEPARVWLLLLERAHIDFFFSFTELSFLLSFHFVVLSLFSSSPFLYISTCPSRTQCLFILLDDGKGNPT